MPTRTRRSNPRERESDRRPIRFNGEISVGTILSIISMIIAMYGFFQSSNEKIKNDMGTMRDQVTSVQTQTAIIETKVDAMWRSFQNTFGKASGN